jgi:hypothetical protein
VIVDPGAALVATGQAAEIQIMENNSSILLIKKWKKASVASNDAPTLTWICGTNVILVGSMCTILVPSTTIYLTKVTALMAKRLGDTVGSHAKQARSSDKLISTCCNNT